MAQVIWGCGGWFHISAGEEVVHLSAEVGAADSEGSGRGLEVSAGSGQVNGCAEVRACATYLPACSRGSGESSYQVLGLLLAGQEGTRKIT